MQTTSAVGESESAGGSESVAATYRPHLDGLRAVAVYLVVLFHAGSSWFPGGYIGVDVFFVLSGFLVTQLLLRDIVGNGKIRLGRFYSRRFRRLLPAAFVVLIVTAAVYTAIASPAEQLDAIGAFKAAFLYSTNWYFIHQSTAYFGANIVTNPVLHFWSLAVEEQFYLVWPLALTGAFVATRRMDRAKQLRVIARVVGVVALASALFALSLRSSNPNRAYYGTDTRAYELLAGALLALVPSIIEWAKRNRRAMRAATVASIVLLGVIASSWIDLDAIERGIAVTITTVVLIVALEVADGGIVKRLLSTRSMTYLGKISYGTYLWHWLVILVVVKAFHPSTASTVGITFLVATGLASFSFQLMEHPIRASLRLDRYRGPVIALGLTVSVVSVLVFVPAILDNPHVGAVSTAGAATTGVTPVPAGLDWQAVKAEDRKAPTCLHKSLAKCTLVHGTGKTVLLVGDSHVQMLIAPFTEIAKAENWTLVVMIWDACPWQAGLWRFNQIDRRSCLTFKTDLRTRVIPQINPDVIVLIHAPLDKEGLKGQHLGGPNGPLVTGSAAAEQAIETATDKTIAAFDNGKRDIVIIEPIPQGPQGYDPLGCLSTAKYLDQCRFVVNPGPSATELHYRELARTNKHVFDLNIDKLACPYLPICDPMVNGKIVWYDLSHLSIAYARTLADPIRSLLTADGIGSG